MDDIYFCLALEWCVNMLEDGRPWMFLNHNMISSYMWDVDTMLSTLFNVLIYLFQVQ